MKISAEFSRHAKEYGLHNGVQNLVVEKLLSFVKSKPKRILDLGCGSGALCSKVNWEYDNFTGLDFAQGMLTLHPKADNIELVYGSFNDDEVLEQLQKFTYDYVVSASALQWAHNIEDVFGAIKKMKAPISLAIFTSNTFKTLNSTAELESLLVSKDEINRIQKEYFDVNFEIVEYKLGFQSVREMFKYIKRSGVSGSRNILSFRQMKKLMNEYPLNYLEFEVAFIYSQ